MNLLKWILIAVCVLKVLSFSLCLVLNSDANEIDLFFERELIRKYNDHSMDIGYISRSSEVIKAIARDSTKKYIGNRDADKWPTFKRTRFQDYARYLRPLDTIWQDETVLDMDRYPKLLRNTIAEEKAKREIYTHLKNIQPEGKPQRNSTLKGMITGIDYSKDSLHLQLIPFFFESRLPFDSCQCGPYTLINKHNPFIYSGSLTNWMCVYKHPKDKEIQTYSLRTIE